MKTKSFPGGYLLLALILPAVLIYSCVNNNYKDIHVIIKNTSSQELTDAIAELNDTAWLSKINQLQAPFFLVKHNDESIPYQLVDNNSDGKAEQMLVLLSLKSGEEKELLVEGTDQPSSFTKRTLAEISIKEGGKWEMVTKEDGHLQYEYKGGHFKNVASLHVPPEHTDHSFYIRYEGPGWESDKVGYRFYLDWRNATDIFGKKTNEMVLQDVGQDGFESYHEPSHWGMDILKVGASLGIGSIGYWTGENAVRVEHTDSIYCAIKMNGDLRSAIKTKYFGWSDPEQTITLKSIISIDAGSRRTHQKLSTSETVSNLCTGIVKHEGAEVIQKTPAGQEWQCLATFGKQSLNNDMLGMAIFYKKNDLIKATEDENNHVLVLKPSENQLEYFYSAIWEQDESHITSMEEFEKYLNSELVRLNSPLKISY